MADKHYLTREGKENLEVELKHLKSVERDAISRRLRDAISMGDLSENADYHKAKEDQGFLEGRIQELEFLLKNAEIIDTSNGRVVVDVGATVTVQEDGDEPEIYMLVGAKEADPRNGRISNESPIGKALLGSRVGSVVTASTPNGSVKFKVLKIE